MSKSVFDILEEVESTQGKNAKVEALRPHVGNARLQQVMYLTNDPYVNFYVGKAPKVKKAPGQHPTSDKPLDELLNALKKCMTGEYRGNAGKEMLVSILTGMNDLERKWSERIIAKKLRLGVGEGTTEKLWPGLLGSFEVSLAKEIEWHLEEGEKLVLDTLISYPVRVDPKWDGFRCIAVKAGGKVTLYARSGRIFETAPAIDAWLEENMKDDWILDGELMAVEWNDTASIVSAKKTKKDDSSVNFYVFDCMTLEQWKSQKCDTPYVERLENIASVLGSKDPKGPVKIAQGEIVKNEKELLAYNDSQLELGFEGIMVKKLDVPYVWDRGTNVMKLKPIVTYDGVVVEVLPGKPDTKWENMYTRLSVMVPSKHNACTTVGTGFKDPDRAFLDENRQKLVGRACEIKGQPPLSKDGKVRFPRFKRWREDWDVSPEVKALIKKIKDG